LAAEEAIVAMSALRVLLVDDHALVLAGIRLLAERIEGVEVVAEAHDGREAVESALKHRPDLVIMDISMQELNGIEAAVKIRQELPLTRVLILSSHTDEAFVRRAIHCGASGYLVKGSVPMELPLAIKAVMQGHLYVSAEISRHLLTSPAGASQSESFLASLTPRQREILQMVAEGKSTKKIAFLLGLSVKTVETHRAAIMERLDIHDVPGLVLFAVRHGLIDADGASRR
jgi:DNA-binding NarL/FixJ family response regulator